MATVERRCLNCESTKLEKGEGGIFYCMNCLSDRTAYLINGVHGLPESISADNAYDAIFKMLLANKKNIRGWTLSPGSRVLADILVRMQLHPNPSAKYTIGLMQELHDNGLITLAKESSLGSGKRFLYQINDEITNRSIRED